MAAITSSFSGRWKNTTMRTVNRWSSTPAAIASPLDTLTSRSRSQLRFETGLSFGRVRALRCTGTLMLRSELCRLRIVGVLGFAHVLDHRSDNWSRIVGVAKLQVHPSSHKAEFH